MGGLIVMVYTSYDVFLHKEMRYVGCNVTAPHLGVKYPKNLHLGHE